ncbi:MAG: DUF6249 domain-containing protein [Candidatus Zixiibacteriota bacterium]
MTPLERFIDMSPVFVIFPVFYLAFKAYLEYKTRLRLVEKDLVDKDVANLFKTMPERHLPNSLKWGLVLTLVGIAAVVIRAFEYVSAETAFGVMLIAAGVGLLTYYVIGSNKLKEINK